MAALSIRVRDYSAPAGLLIARTIEDLQWYSGSGMPQMPSQTHLHLDHLYMLVILQQYEDEMFSEIRNVMRERFYHILTYPEHHRYSQLVYDLQELAPLMDESSWKQVSPIL